MNIQAALTKADFSMITSLKEGSQFELGELLPGLDPDEPVVWDVLENVEVKSEPPVSRMTLHAYYHEVFLLSASITYSDLNPGTWSFG